MRGGVHLERDWGRLRNVPACGHAWGLGRRGTRDPAKVTCGGCRRTLAWRKAMMLAETQARPAGIDEKEVTP